MIQSLELSILHNERQDSNHNIFGTDELLDPSIILFDISCKNKQLLLNMSLKNNYEQNNTCILSMSGFIFVRPEN